MKHLLFLLAALASTASAHVKLPALFTDHVVLQRNRPIPVWGWADEGEQVTVTLATQTKQAITGPDHVWKVMLDALKTSSNPAELTVSGKNRIVVKDVLVGEVWICSGQSNMALRVQACQNASQEIAAANLPDIRLFTVPLAVADEPQTDIPAGKAPPAWNICSPETVGAFSAAGFFFGRELHDKLRVPLGLINTSWGGTRCEAWTSKPALEASSTCKTILTAWDEYLRTYNPDQDKRQYEAAQAAQIARIQGENAKLPAGAEPKPLPTVRRWEDQTQSQHRPAVLYNAMISPLAPFAMRGAIWYQGESNRDRANQYRTLLPIMIKDWRKRWGDDFSFYIVQLAGFGNNLTGPREVGADDHWAELQWVQLQTAIKTPKCGLAVTNDIGDETSIHPVNKQEVGRRLSLQALVKDYKETDLVSGGPIYAGGTTEAGKFVINFSNAQHGLKSRDGGDLKGFIIAGEDKVWKAAKARIINGKQVRVWNDEIKAPAAVRYAWASWCPEANLINKEGLPTSVFRTDKWELSTQGVESPFSNEKKAAPPKSANSAAKAKP